MDHIHIQTMFTRTHAHTRTASLKITFSLRIHTHTYKATTPTQTIGIYFSFSIRCIIIIVIITLNVRYYFYSVQTHEHTWIIPRILCGNLYDTVYGKADMYTHIYVAWYLRIHGGGVAAAAAKRSNMVLLPSIGYRCGGGVHVYMWHQQSYHTTFSNTKSSTNRIKPS